MANAETTFADRLGRGRTMKSTIAAFSPAFAPADADLLPAAFDVFLQSVEDKNSAVAAADTQFKLDAALRTGLMTTIKDRSTQVRGYVNGKAAWSIYQPAVRRAADAVRGYRPPKPKPATPPAGAAPKKRNQGQQSFAEVENLFNKVLEAIKPISDYAPVPDSNIQKGQLSSLLNGFRTANRDVDTSDAALTTAQTARLKIYDEAGGLKEKMLAIKEAAKGQYGSRSAQYKAVKAVKV